MKLSKNAYLILAFFFFVELIYSLFNKDKTHELFFWEVNIWTYRFYRFALVLFIVKLYFDHKKAESLNNL